MTATTSKSRKAKGRVLQQEIREEIIRVLGIPEEDVLSTPMGQSGPDIILSKEARSRCPFAFEAKNQEHIQIWQALDQAKAHAGRTGLAPALVFRKSRTPAWVAMELTTFLDLMKKANNNTGGVGES